MRLPPGLGRFNRVVTNPIQGVWAWLVPPWAVILHRGRRSGRGYRTPLIAFRGDGALVIALLYGERTDWLRNLQAGGGHLIRRGRTVAVGPPEVVAASEAAAMLARLSAPGRAYCRLAESLAVLEPGERLPGFGPRRGG
jgi:deazaflavin-dependent oxidoreductase (nitroreductase family)